MKLPASFMLSLFVALLFVVVADASGYKPKHFPVPVHIPKRPICIKKVTKCCYRFKKCGFVLKKVRVHKPCPFKKCFKVCHKICKTVPKRRWKKKCRRVRVKHIVHKCDKHGCYDFAKYKKVRKCRWIIVTKKKKVCKFVCKKICKIIKARCTFIKVFKIHKFCPFLFCHGTVIVGPKPPNPIFKKKLIKILKGPKKIPKHYH